MHLFLVIEANNTPGSWSAAIPILEKYLVIGRGNNCDIVLCNPKISRQTITVSRVDDHVLVTACNKLNPFVFQTNPCVEAVLRSGETFSLYNYTFRIENHLPDNADWEKFNEKTSLEVSHRVKSNALRDLLEAVGSPTNAGELLKDLLLGFVKLFKADRGFVLLRDGFSDKLVSVTSHAVDNVDDFVNVSSTIYGQVLESGKVVHIENSRSNEATQGLLSLETFICPRTIIAAPLTQGGNVLGVVYLDSLWTGGEEKFFDTKLISSFCSIVTGIISAGVTRQKLLHAKECLGAISSCLNVEDEILWGKSVESNKLKSLIESAGPKDVTVLLTGETGTGKEVVAKALHAASSRSSGPFIPLHCAAIATELLEAELFGVEKGAFTGADKRRVGRFELAMGGTLFLDELGEIPLEVQIKLLRVLEERKVTRVGGTEVINLDLRLICATNVALEDAVRDGSFREDLYYRINVFRIELPSLKARGDDVLTFADGFLSSFSLKFSKNIKRFSGEARDALLSYSWPGNMRELRNVIERAVILEQSDEVSLVNLAITDNKALLSSSEDPFSTYPDVFSDARKLFEKEFFQHRLNSHNGNIEELALTTGMSRSTLYRRLLEFGLVGSK